MAKIRADCVKRPSVDNMTSSNYVPPNSSQRRVTSGEGFFKIARAMGIEPWSLVWFNFPTVGSSPSQKGAREVNWYLQEYLGCTEVTPDRKNYKFHEGMKRPYIYVPVQVVDFAGSIITARLPSHLWFGFGLKSVSPEPTYGGTPLIQVTAKEDHYGALFSYDEPENWFELEIAGTRYGPRLSGTVTPSGGGLVAYVATGVKMPKKLDGHEISGVDFSLQLGPLSKALKSAGTAWKLRGPAKVAVKAGLTIAEWEKTRSIFKEVIKALEIDWKSATPKLHVIDLPIGIGLEASIYYLSATSSVKFTHINKPLAEITSTVEDVVIP